MSIFALYIYTPNPQQTFHYLQPGIKDEKDLFLLDDFKNILLWNHGSRQEATQVTWFKGKWVNLNLLVILITSKLRKSPKGYHLSLLFIFIRPRWIFERYFYNIHWQYWSIWLMTIMTIRLLKRNTWNYGSARNYY